MKTGAHCKEILTEYELTSIPGTRREKEVAKLLAWGGTYRQVSIALEISTSTVDNTIKKLRERLGLNSVAEVTPWWFCNAPRIPFEMSPFRRGAFGVVLFLFMLPNMLDINFEARRIKVNIKSKSYATRTIRSTRRK